MQASTDQAKKTQGEIEAASANPKRADKSLTLGEAFS